MTSRRQVLWLLLAFAYVLHSLCADCRAEDEPTRIPLQVEKSSDVKHHMVSEDAFADMKALGMGEESYWVYDENGEWKNVSSDTKGMQRWLYVRQNNSWVTPPFAKEGAPPGTAPKSTPSHQLSVRERPPADLPTKLADEIASTLTEEKLRSAASFWQVRDTTGQFSDATDWYITNQQNYDSLRSRLGSAAESYWTVDASGRWKKVDRNAPGAQAWLFTNRGWIGRGTSDIWTPLNGTRWVPNWPTANFTSSDLRRVAVGSSVPRARVPAVAPLR